MKLTEKKCIPCEDNTLQPLSCDEVGKIVTDHGAEIEHWEINDTCTRMVYEKLFTDFVTAMEFVNRVAELAELEGHHPDITIHYNKITLDLWTHSIGGLSENDVILAAKINAL
jgi:4a-hydroxytetrahydrobiopterin dehydratase